MKTMLKILIEKKSSHVKMWTSFPHSIMIKIFPILSAVAIILFAGLSSVKAETIFNGELFAHFASPVGITFRLFHQGQLIVQNQDGFIDFGNLSYIPTIGLWLPTQMCSDTNIYCYRLTINMEPVGVMGDFDLNVQYVQGNNPNNNAGFPFNQRGGLGRKVAATVKTCETLPGSNGVIDCYNALNPTGPAYAFLLENISAFSLSMNNTTNYYQLEFFVNSFDPNLPIFPGGAQPAEAFTNLDHYGSYEGTLVITATAN